MDWIKSVLKALVAAAVAGAVPVVLDTLASEITVLAAAAGAGGVGGFATWAVPNKPKS